MTGKQRWFSRVLPRLKLAAPPESKNASGQSASGFVALHTTMAAGWTPVSYGALANEGFMRNPVVHRCVRMIAEAAGSLPWVAYEGDRKIGDHPALALVERPNAFGSRSELVETLCGHLLLSGNAYLEHVLVDTQDHYGQMFALRPDRITCDTDDTGWPSAYFHDTGKNRRRIDISGTGGIAPILHLKLFHPLDDLNGFPPLQAALMALDTHNAAATWNKALLDNAARPSGALIYAPGDGGTLSQEQFDSIKQELANTYSGSENAGKPLLLEGGLDWKAMGLSPKDMDFIEAKNAASRDIALAFGVPPMLLGIPGDNTYANYQEAHRAFFRLTVLPMIRRVADAIGSWLAAGHGAPFRFALDLDQVESLNTERAALWTRIEAASFLSDDEKRVAVGYSPIGESGDL